MITVEHVTKSYDGKIILDGINLQLETNKTHVLLGLSGSGKSTLLQIMIGLIPPDQGAIRFGADVMTPATRRELSQKIGYMPQGAGFFRI